MATINNTTSTSSGITLSSGDVLSNSGTITAPDYGVLANAGAYGVSVGNTGVITGGGTTGAGIKFSSGGSVTNASGAYIGGEVGIQIVGTTGVVVNSGTIVGDGATGLGVQLGFGGSVTNQSSGTISAEAGLDLGGPSTVTNFGLIAGNTSGGAGIELHGGGTVFNEATSGTISGGGGITAQAAATIVNAGLIQSYATVSDAVLLSAGGSITNQSGGTISGSRAVVIGGGGGSLVNQQNATISATYGVSIAGIGTVTNAGTITGTQNAVQFTAGYSDLLQVAPGASFSGRVDGGNAIGSGTSSTLELLSSASAGTLSGLGSNFIDFAQIDIDGGADWTLQGTVVSGQSVSVASTGTVEFAPGIFSGTIDGLQQGGSIVLTGIANATSATVLSGNTLEISLSSGGPIDLQLDQAGTYTTNQFHVATIGSNAVVAENVACYLAGTRIRTEHGEVAVELLRIGDRLVTRDGSAKPVRWIGRRSYSGAIPAGLRDVVPVAIAPGALADGVPARELIVSPLHALYLDGVLAPAERLVNGRTICRRPDIDPIRYFHIELERHDVIFAEGAAAESFVDCDSRTMFHNAAEYAALYPGEAAERWVFCAPRVEGGEKLAAIRRRLDARAGLPAETPDTDPGPLLGRLDGVENGRIAGWAFQPERPHQPVWLEVLDGDGVVARVEARRYRADLEAAEIGDGRHGFELNLIGRLADGHVIRVRRVADGAELEGSPLVLRPVDAAALAEEARRLVASAVADPHDAKGLDALSAALLRGIDTLKQARLQGAQPAVPAGRRRQRRALIVDSVLPRPERDAGSQAVLSHAAALRELGWQVEFIAPHALADLSADAAALEDAGYRVHRAPQVASVEEVLRRNRNGFDLVYLHRLANAESYAPLARQWQSRARLIYSVADLHHLRVGRQAEVQSSEELAAAAAALRVREINAMRLADAVVTHSDAEAGYLARLAPGAVVHVVPWVPATRPSAVPFAARQGVACIGAWTHEPNVDAVRWLAGTIMPKVWQRAPRIELLVAGSGWPASVPWIADGRLRVVGPVGSLDPLLAMVRLSVAPLRFGAGLKGKVLDSFAAAVPAVMTSVAAEGFALQDAARELVADDAEDIAALVVRAHEDAAFNRAAAAAGRRMVDAAFSADAVKMALQRALGDVPSAALKVERAGVSCRPRAAAEVAPASA